MKRRDFITLLGGAASWPLAARAQPVAGKVPLIGFLQFGGTTENIAAFMQGLRDAGYIDGRSAIVEARYYDIDRVALALTREWSGGARRRRFVQ
jgi:putative ABC transport system substrate-binding protein